MRPIGIPAGRDHVAGVPQVVCVSIQGTCLRDAATAPDRHRLARSRTGWGGPSPGSASGPGSVQGDGDASGGRLSLQQGDDRLVAFRYVNRPSRRTAPASNPRAGRQCGVRSAASTRPPSPGSLARRSVTARGEGVRLRVQWITTQAQDRASVLPRREGLLPFHREAAALQNRVHVAAPDWRASQLAWVRWSRRDSSGAPSPASRCSPYVPLRTSRDARAAGSPLPSICAVRPEGVPSPGVTPDSQTFLNQMFTASFTEYIPSFVLLKGSHSGKEQRHQKESGCIIV